MPGACVLAEYGPPDVLEWKRVPTPEPAETQIRIKVRVSGVGPTDLKIRRGDLDGVFPLPQPAVLGFETAGVVDAIGRGVRGVAVGDEVAAWLPSLGGYGEYALAAAWTPKPPHVSWTDAGATPINWMAIICEWTPDFTTDERHRGNPPVMKHGSMAGLAVEYLVAQTDVVAHAG